MTDSQGHDARDTELTALRKRVEELEGALEPFSNIVTTATGWVKITPATDYIASDDLRWEHFARARAALRAKGGEHGE